MSFAIGDRVRVNKLEPNPKLHGQVGTVVSVEPGNVRVRMDVNLFGWKNATGRFEPNWLIPIEDEGTVSLTEMEKAVILAGLVLLHNRANLDGPNNVMPGLIDNIESVRVKLLPGRAAMGLPLA